MAISLIATNLGTLSVLGPLYGIFVVLFMVSTYGFMQRARRHSTGVSAMWTSPLFLASLVFFLAITTGWILNIARSFAAFIYYQGGTAPAAFYGDPSEWSDIAALSCVLVTLVTGDTVLVYRVRVIWNRRISITVFPALCVIVTIGLDIANIMHHVHYHVGEDLHEALSGPYSIGPIVLTLCNNLSCSGLIAWRVWQQHKKTQEQTLAYNVKMILMLIIESAAIYAAWGIMLLVALQTGSSIVYTFSDTWGPVTGIAFMLINVNSILGWTNPDYRKSTDRSDLESRARDFRES